MKAVCVFCGSSPGARNDYRDAVVQLAEVLVERDLTLVYGGGNVGLMGVLADAMLERSGTVIGVIPRALASKEVAHWEISELRIVETMHDRKLAMYEASDGFLALPGGIGTLEEFFEVLTWAQLGMHDKPCGLLDVAGYFKGLLDFLDHAMAERFYKPRHRAMVLVDSHADRLLDKMDAYCAPGGDKWIDRRDA